MSGGGGGGIADADTSLNQLAELGGRRPRRWGKKEWIWFLLALTPRVAVAVVAWLR
jgi:hypothetical protein